MKNVLGSTSTSTTMVLAPALSPIKTPTPQNLLTRSISPIQHRAYNIPTRMQRRASSLERSRGFVKVLYISARAEALYPFNLSFRFVFVSRYDAGLNGALISMTTTYDTILKENTHIFSAINALDSLYHICCWTLHTLPRRPSCCCITGCCWG